jgi:hypothetical protein
VLVVGVCDACSRNPGRKATRRHTLEHVHPEGAGPAS